MRLLRRLALAFAVLAVLPSAVLPSAAGAATTVRVGYIPVLGIGQLFVLDGAGWAREAGLELKLTQFDSGPAMISALASGTLDAYMGGIGPVMVASGRGVPVKVVAATAVEELAVVGRGAFAQTPGADTAAGFKAFVERTGRKVRIATQPAGSVPDTVLRYWLQTVAKVDPGYYEIVAMGIDQTQQAILSGAVDAATIREPALTIVLGRDSSAKLLVLGGKMMENQPGSVLALTRGFLDKEPQAAQALVRQHVRATALLRDKPAQAAPYLQAGLGKGIVDTATFERALASPASNFVADPERIRAATGVMQDFQLRLGVLDKPADLGTLFDPSLYRAAEANP